VYERNGETNARTTSRQKLHAAADTLADLDAGRVRGGAILVP
jgi:hypothetical protein